MTQSFRRLTSGTYRHETNENRMNPPAKQHLGSSIDDFLKEEGIFDEAQAQAIKEVVAWQLHLENQHGPVTFGKQWAKWPSYGVVGSGLFMAWNPPAGTMLRLRELAERHCLQVICLGARPAFGP